MFEALVLVCAASASQEIYRDSCFVLKDSSTFNTIESCEVRTDEMVNEVLNSGLTFIIVDNYRRSGIFPELLYAEGKCIAPGEQI